MNELPSYTPPDETQQHEVDRPVVEIASVNRILEILGPKAHETRFLKIWEDSSTGADEEHPLGQWSTLTTPENPAVIYDDGATLCCAIITIDAAGRALHMHDSLITSKNYGKAAKTYFETLPEYVQPNKTTCCVAGINVELSNPDTEINPIDTLLNFVEKQAQKTGGADNFQCFVSKQYDNQQRYSDMIPEKTAVKGLVFIPKYLATDNKNHLMLVNTETAEKIRAAFL